MPLGRLFKAGKEEASVAIERRRSLRHITVLQVAKLRIGGAEELCLLRDVSEEGLRAEIYVSLEIGDSVSVELRTGHCVAGRVAWCEPPMMGMQFAAAVPILSMLAHCAFDERLTKLRPPRIDLDLPASLRTVDETIEARVSNISQAGLRIEAGRPLPSDTWCTVTLPSLAARSARLRWSHKGECGLQLDQPLSYREFATWRQMLHAARSAGAV